MPDSVLNISKEKKYQTVGELIEKGKPSELFYVLLFLSSIIIAGGILTNNIPIIIGGMLVTPMLAPILVMGLAVAVGRGELLRETSLFLFKSVFAVILGSFLLGFVFGADVMVPDLTFTNLSRFIYLIVAFASGVAVTYAWVRRDASDILPGIAIVVSLVPPLSWIGVGLARGFFDPAFWQISQATGIIFILNLMGIIAGSALVFRITGFRKMTGVIDRKHEQVREEKERRQDEQSILVPLAKDEDSA